MATRIILVIEALALLLAGIAIGYIFVALMALAGKV